MKPFTSIEALIEHIKKEVDIALAVDVAEVVKQTEQSAIYEEVYNAYEPKEYSRRFAGGGLITEKNIKAEVVSEGVLRVTNETPFNENGGSSNSGTGLDQLIEYGHGGGGYYYEGKPGSYMNPRPFTERTAEELASSKDHIEALKAGLKARGIPVK